MCVADHDTNHPCVDSILLGFQDGFWPAAKSDLLISQQQGHDNHQQEDSMDDTTQEFLKHQCDIEIGFG